MAQRVNGGVMQRLHHFWLLWVAAFLLAGPGNACEDGRGIQTGINWINNTCAKGDIVECYDVADSEVRSMAEDPPCDGFSPALIKRHVNDVRALMAKLRKQDRRLPKIVAARRAGRMIEDSSRGVWQGEPLAPAPLPQLPPPGCYDNGSVWVCQNQ
jgi:ribosomal protein L39E